MDANRLEAVPAVCPASREDGGVAHQVSSIFRCRDKLAGYGMVGVRLATTLVTLPLTAFAASAFYHHRRRGLVAGLLYLLYSAAFVGNDMLAVNCELVMLLPLTWALVLVRDQADVFRPRRLLGAGLLIGVATLVKYQAALWLPPVTIAVALECWSTDRR